MLLSTVVQVKTRFFQILLSPFSMAVTVLPPISVVTVLPCTINAHGQIDEVKAFCLLNVWNIQVNSIWKSNRSNGNNTNNGVLIKILYTKAKYRKLTLTGMYTDRTDGIAQMNSFDTCLLPLFIHRNNRLASEWTHNLFAKFFAYLLCSTFHRNVQLVEQIMERTDKEFAANRCFF